MGIYARHDGEWYRVDEGGSAGADLLGGVAGWAAIESVTGTATPDQAGVDQLIDDGIAPTGATHDDECPGTYNIVGDDGVVYRVAVWTDVDATHSIDTTNGLIEGVLISGGSAGAGSYGGTSSQGLPSWNNGLYELGDGPKDVVVGKHGLPNGGSVHANAQSTGKPSLVGDWSSGTSGAGGGPLTLTSSISGLSVEYGTAAIGGSGGSFSGSGVAYPGTDGIVIVRAPKDAANNPKPDAPVAWGQFDSVPTGFTDEGAYVDGKGRAWKWYEFADEGDFEIDLTGGQYWVLTVGGGDGGQSNDPTYENQGQPGLVTEGYWEFAKNPSTAITVGKKGTGNSGFNATNMGQPSSIGNYGTQGAVGFGNFMMGRGAQEYNDRTGYQSTITGKSLEYAPGNSGPDRPGRPGNRDNATQTDGCVIIATVTNEQSDWNPPGALPGLGGWASITDVKGKGKKYSYTDADGDWVAYEWTGTGTVDVRDGIIEHLVVGGGSGGGPKGGGGKVAYGLQMVSQQTAGITVGKGGTGAVTNGQDSKLDLLPVDVTGSKGMNSGNNGGTDPGYSLDILGFDKIFGAGSEATAPNSRLPNSGASRNNSAGVDGVVIVRVPKANDLFKDIAGSAAGEPFDIPTTRQAVAAALEEKVEAVKDTMIIDGRETKIKRNRKR